MFLPGIKEMIMESFPPYWNSFSINNFILKWSQIWANIQFLDNILFDKYMCIFPCIFFTVNLPKNEPNLKSPIINYPGEVNLNIYTGLSQNLHESQCSFEDVSSHFTVWGSQDWTMNPSITVFWEPSTGCITRYLIHLCAVEF